MRQSSRRNEQIAPRTLVYCHERRLFYTGISTHRKYAVIAYTRVCTIHDVRTMHTSMLSQICRKNTRTPTPNGRLYVHVTRTHAGYYLSLSNANVCARKMRFRFRRWYGYAHEAGTGDARSYNVRAYISSHCIRVPTSLGCYCCYSCHIRSSKPMAKNMTIIIIIK